MADASERTVLLVNVGGTPAPIAFSIEHHKPKKVIFFASRDSRSEIEPKVKPLLTHRWNDQEIVTTPDHQDLVRCIEVLARELPERLNLLGCGWRDLIVDFTGGTKAMSAAVVLATISEAVEYSYIGGKVHDRSDDVRSKGGLGTVLDGSEAVLRSANPWDTLAIDFKRRMTVLFNQGSFREAKQAAEEAIARVSRDRRWFFEDLREVFDAYLRWSNFDYPKAVGPLRNGLKGLCRTSTPGLDRFLKQVEQDAERLDLIVPAFRALQTGKPADPDGVRALLLDLVANAVRTVRLAHRPDDGVARLYSAIEKLGKFKLSEHGIDNSRATPDAIPEGLRENFARRFLDREKGTLKFGLDASYRVLAELGDPVGLSYLAHETEISGLLDARNSSLMVHGWSPIKVENFDRMLSITLEFLGLFEGELPQLPVLSLEAR
jgi:CRISPR-associated protein (TIGR02710 family)